MTAATLADRTARAPRATTLSGRGGPRRRGAGRSRFGGFLFVVPSLAILSLVLLVPIGMSLYFSFTDYSLLSDPDWAGLENYRTLMSDASFAAALRHTAVYTLISVPLQTVVALLVADVLAKRFRNRFGAVVRSALFVPVVSSLVLVGTVWRFMLGTNDGLVNNLLNVFGMENVNFLGQPTLALVVVSLATVWKNIGYFLVIYYAGIMNVPTELYEASSLDGASRWQQFRSVTVPVLRPVTLLVVILGTIWSFQVFDLVYVMTGGGPGGATTTLVMAIYEAAFQDFHLGYASAMAMVLFGIVLVVSIVQRKAMGHDD